MARTSENLEFKTSPASMVAGLHGALTGGRTVIGSIGAVLDAARARSKNPSSFTSEVFTVRAGDRTVGLMSMTKSRGMVPQLKVAVVSLDSTVDADDLVVQCSAFARRVTRAHWKSAWLVTDVPDTYGTGRMAPAGWGQTQTVKNGSRRYLMPVRSPGVEDVGEEVGQERAT